jgi:ATP-binding cassette subfamily F protein 3
MDIESIQWLEDFLINSAKAVVVISHDRTFVDNITTLPLKLLWGVSMIIKPNILII